jgi:hypothetical protein
MAFFKYGHMLMLRDGNAFDKHLEPGQRTLRSGIYRCTNCGCEVVARAHDHLPPQDHSQHGDTGRPVRWRLLVQAEDRV